MKTDYDFNDIEEKIQQLWDNANVYVVDEDTSKEKYYVLDMFPYPSGAGLHVGHILAYTVTDCISRYKRMKGFNVLHPMGWDSFGLPTEQYAIRHNIHPRDVTRINIANFKKQLKRMGFSYDWSREFATSDPEYYKWTQWIFTLLHKKGLAYQSKMPVNYCPELRAVLANEEVEDGLSKEGGYPVKKVMLKQWVLKITKYADSLLDGLDDLDWPESIKTLQKNWIGRSEGVELVFEFVEKNKKIKAFTTRPDTIMGCTFVCVSPELNILKSIMPEDKQEAFDTFKEHVSRMSDRDRIDQSRESIGFNTGLHVKHPITQEDIPVWVADYVLDHYGTGCVMAVPGHDERDYKFAKKYNLPVKCVIRPNTKDLGELGVDIDDYFSKMLSGEQVWIGTGVSMNSSGNNFSIDGLTTSDARSYVKQWLKQERKGKETIQYKLRDWLFSRQRYWGEPIPVVYQNGEERVLEPHELPLTPPELDDYSPHENGKSPLKKHLIGWSITMKH